MIYLKILAQEVSNKTVIGYVLEERRMMEIR
jgi:hypothetical protein